MANTSAKWTSGRSWREPSSSSSPRYGIDQLQGNSRPDPQNLNQDTDEAAKKIAEGRRIYLGNILYEVKPDEIEDMLAANGFQEDVENVHISIDAVTARNPGYCFVDFKSSDSARSALENLPGSAIRDRPVKVGPCKPKGAERAWKKPNYTPTFQRWGDWRGQRAGPGGDDDGHSSESQNQPQQGPYKALEHFQGVKENGASARVYLGGLGKMSNQVEHDEEVRGLLGGFNVIAISKRVTPHPSTRTKPGNHHYCFVDFETEADAEAVIRALGGRSVPGGRLRVSMAHGLPTSARD
ncbi:RNA recognition domain-containing protein [Diaporthe helianthi]|uniref:RNA recognition domain-containing protein n=1 Tax=Diaporthe helianthi TaxID=158607 RepID=A0A2P5HZW0_DIAHE|nr:RNA recognition domain-containing protein [Diaporthe helianthi]